MFLFKKWKPFVHPFYNLKKQSDPWLTNLGCQQRFCEIDDLTCENRFFRQFVLVWISRRNGKIEDLTITPPCLPLASFPPLPPFQMQSSECVNLAVLLSFFRGFYRLYAGAANSKRTPIVRRCSLNSAETFWKN